MARQGKDRDQVQQNNSKPSSGSTRPEVCADDRPTRHETRGRLEIVSHGELAATRQAAPADWLREARIAKGLSLEDVARTTKVSLPILTAIEAGDIPKLPAPIFTRGFVKAYAQEVGLDPDETADLYLAVLVPESLAVEAENARLKMAMPVESAEVQAFDHDRSRLINKQQSGRFGPFLLAAAVVGLIAYLGWFGWNNTAPPPQNPLTAAVPPPAEAAPAAQAAPAPAPDAAPAALAPATPPVDGPLQVELKPQGPCWLSAAADGTPVLSELLQAGDSRKIEVKDELVLRVGDGGACAFSINGQAGRSLGKPGAPVNVRITKDNYREFLSS